MFPCGRWLARDEDDRAIERDLVPLKSIDENLKGYEVEVKEKNIRDRLESNLLCGDYVRKIKTIKLMMRIVFFFKVKNYQVEIFTGSEFGAGTDANVFIQLFGDEGETARVRLNDPFK